MNDRTVSTSVTTRRGLRAVLATSLLASVIVIGPMAPVAFAAPLITGTVTNDANANGVIDTAVGTGAETGLGGVTVELLDGSGNPVDPDGAGPLTQTVTTTAADGSYSLDAQADGTYIVRVTAPAGYIIDAAAAGDITRTSPTSGQSAPVVLAGADSVVNPLVRPDFVLQLGYLNNPDGVITGSAPFDTTDPACTPDPGAPSQPTLLNDTTTPAGVDCTKYDDNVRSGDNVAFNFAISGSAEDDTVATVNDVVLQQTITPTGGAVVNFARIPIACVPPSGGAGGTPPPFSKVEYWNGSTWVDYTGAGYTVPQDLPPAAVGRPLRLTCNKGTYSTGDASTIGTTVRVDPTSPNGSSFTSEAVLFATDNDGNATAVPDEPLGSPAIEIKARPEWDLRKGGFYRQDWTTHDPDGGGPLPSTAGFFTYFNIMIGSNRKSGNEPLQQPLVLQDQMYFFRGDGTTPVSLTLGTDYFLGDCRDFWPQSLGNSGGNVISKPSLATSPYTTNMAVQDSGTCTVNGTTGQITWSGIDFGGPYPTVTNTNQSLAAGPYLVANKWLRVWVPYTTLDNLFGDAANNDAGSGFFWNRVTGFDPLGVSGNSNYGTGVEPGWCDPAVTPTAANTGCTVLPATDLLTGQTKSNDVAGPTSFVFSPGVFNKHLLKPNGNDRSYVVHDDMSNPHDGAGTIQPNQYTSTWLHWQALSSTYENPVQCDIWDNTMYKLVPLAEANVGANNGVSSSLYATSTGAGTNPGLLVYEFTNIPISGDNPLSGALNGATGRYDGTWTDQRSSNCDEPGVTWFTNPNDVPGGIDNVNAVRVTGRSSGQTVGATPTMFPGQDRLLRVGLLARDTFYGGPNDGDAIPSGAVGANYGKIKSSNRSTGAGIGLYNSPNYIPAPENTSTDGDRLTWTRAVLGIKKRTIALDSLCGAPCAAAIDTNGSVLAGQFVVWEMLPVVNAASTAPADVPDVIVTDVLPVYVEYDAACTALLTGGTPPDDVQINTPGPGQTTLIWYLGSVTPNVQLPPLRICTGTDPLAPAPASVTNRVDMDSAAIPTSHPFDTHTLTLEQSSDLKLRKTVDAPLDVLNDDQVWTVSYANFSETVAVQPIRTIEVFPYVGDATPPGGPTRNPASQFTGELELVAVIDPKYADGTDVPGTAFYSADAPSTINQNWNLNTSTWCSSTDGVTFTLVHGAGTCPASLADVTAWMFNESNALSPVTNPNKNRVNIPFTLQAGDPLDPLSVDANSPGDRYTNRFTAFSNTFVSAGLPQRLSSNTVRVRTLGFSAGDFVWDDRNGDGLYTEGTDFPVPDGVTINLYYVPTSGPAVLFDSTSTVDGTYLFTDLPSGDFYIEIPASFFGAGQLLEGWDITPAPASVDVEENDDVSHDAIPGTAGAVVSQTFTLSATVNTTTGAISGDEPTADSLHGVSDPTLVTDGFNNFTIDLALQSPVVSIGDYVWFDENRDGLQTSGEPVAAGVTVELYAADGTTLLDDTTTDGFGFYSFTDLTYSTSYQVKFVLPTGTAFTTQFGGGVLVDSNANPSTGFASVITPADGNNSATTPDEPTIDAGLVEIELTITKTLDTAPNFWPGKTVTYTITPQNLGATDALAGWSVTDVLPSQLTLVSMAGTGGPSTYTCVANVCTSSVPLAAGASGEPITVTATINAGVTGLVRNVTYVSPDGDDVVEEIPLGSPPPADTDTDTTTTNNDDHVDFTANRYDLALAKVSDVTSVELGDLVEYTITVANQGSVASGDFTVVDVVPAGLTVDESSISNGGVYDDGDRTITWALTGLAATDPDATLAVTYSVEVTDLNERPWRNFAEITTDSGSLWGGDEDSTPDTDTTNDGDYDTPGVDNASIADAGVGADPEDDADIAELGSEVLYDLALAKTPSATTVNPDGTVTFTVTVVNQGNVNSGEFEITDTLPAGTAATAASNDGVMVESTVTWSLDDLAPGDSTTVTVTVAVINPALRPFKNIAEISADGADSYDVVGSDVEDADSTPDTTVDNDNDASDDGYGTFENPTNDLDDIADVDTQPNGEDDADVAFFDVAVLYDLALVKTGPATIDGAGVATFTIEVKNQGNVPSGEFTVTDTIPTGLAAMGASDGGVVAGNTVTWLLTGLAPGATRTITVEVQVVDFTSGPWTNYAEISADGADVYDSDGYESDADGDVEDDDSVPNANTADDVLIDQTVLPTDQFNDPTVDEDDHDIAPIDVDVDYDLALVKVLPANQRYKVGDSITFNIVVKNQGNVPSGPVSVQDVIPAGLTFVSATDGGLNAAQVVTWELANLQPGEVHTFTVVVRMVDATKTTYVNFAEIVADGAVGYGPGVSDDDSTPDGDITNDLLVDTDDVNIDQIPGDEDDHDRALLDPAKVRSDNPKSGTIPGTGSNTAPLLYLAAALAVLGALALLATRRRRQPA